MDDTEIEITEPNYEEYEASDIEGNFLFESKLYKNEMK